MKMKSSRSPEITFTLSQSICMGCRATGKVHINLCYRELFFSSQPTRHAINLITIQAFRFNFQTQQQHTLIKPKPAQQNGDYRMYYIRNGNGVITSGYPRNMLEIEKHYHNRCFNERAKVKIRKRINIPFPLYFTPGCWHSGALPIPNRLQNVPK